MSAGSSKLWKTLFLPPLFALLLYLFTIHILFPLSQRLHSHRSSSTYLPPSLSSRLPSLQTLLHPGRTSVSSGESLLGDEELEEGLLDDSEPAFGRREEGERRLSRELEVGFRDDSDEEREGDRRERQ